MIQPDGRWLMCQDEINGKIWEKLKGWRLDTSDPKYMIPSFPECRHRSLTVTCKPCGVVSTLGYWCEKKKSWISVSYCNGCVALGEHL